MKLHSCRSMGERSYYRALARRSLFQLSMRGTIEAHLEDCKLISGHCASVHVAIDIIGLHWSFVEGIESDIARGVDELPNVNLMILLGDETDQMGPKRHFSSGIV